MSLKGDIVAQFKILHDKCIDQYLISHIFTGDTPIVGAGTYANHLCAVSGTGRGEEFIKHTVAKEVAAIMEYKELPLGKAVYKVIHEKLPENMGGLVAVSTSGEVAMAFNTPSMFRASAQEGGERMIGIW